MRIGGVVFETGARDGLVAGQRVVFGIRPEHLHLGDGGLPLVVVVVVVVVVVELTGSETHVICRFGQQDVVAVFRERHAFTAGQAISLWPAPDQVVLFDAETRKRIG